MKQNKNTWFYTGGSRLDQTDDFQKFCRSGLDRIQFYRNRTELGLKNFTVRSSLVLFITHIPFVVNQTFTTTLTERLQCLEQGWARFFKRLRVKETSKMQTEKT